MSAFSLDQFKHRLHLCLPENFSGAFCVALSGGLDSCVLLQAMSEVCAIMPQWRLRAVHVDHQLNPASRAWAAHCARLANRLRIDLQIEQVDVARDSTEGLEAAARKVRYAALLENLKPNEVLLTAHHADDQAETLLLALLRGSGVQGLAAMPTMKPFGAGWHARPLLSFLRRDLSAWASAQGIEAVCDPSNADIHHDRNYLRHEVMPKFSSRWPATNPNIARAAAHLGEANALLHELAHSDLIDCGVENCLRVETLNALSSARRRNLLRYWVQRQGLRLPSQRKLADLETGLLTAATDRMPCVRWEDAEVRWYRGLLYANRARAEFQPQEISWDGRESLLLPAQLGQLSLVEKPGGLSLQKLSMPLTIKFRQGGERIRLAGRSHRHELKKFLQQQAVLPWWRSRIPLLYSGDELIAVADWAISHRYASAANEMGAQIVWRDKPAMIAVGSDDRTATSKSVV